MAKHHIADYRFYDDVMMTDGWMTSRYVICCRCMLALGSRLKKCCSDKDDAPGAGRIADSLRIYIIKRMLSSIVISGCDKFKTRGVAVVTERVRICQGKQ